MLAGQARQILDAVGLPQATTVASGSLDETAIQRLVEVDAPLSSVGVGTKMGVSADAPYLAHLAALAGEVGAAHRRSPTAAGR